MNQILYFILNFCPKNEVCLKSEVLDSTNNVDPHFLTIWWLLQYPLDGLLSNSICCNNSILCFRKAVSGTLFSSSPVKYFKYYVLIHELGYTNPQVSPSRNKVITLSRNSCTLAALWLTCQCFWTDCAHTAYQQTIFTLIDHSQWTKFDSAASSSEWHCTLCQALPPGH